MSSNADQFGKSLIASTLMTADEIREFWNALSTEERPKDGASFAKLLVEQKKLTSFQAAEILAGRGARLRMGEYVLLAEIGAGGMGQVYKARHRRMKRIVALKVMSQAAMRDDAAVKRFQREVHAAARLEHPNIVTAYDSGESGNQKYLVMQFVDGGDLAEMVKKHGPLDIESAVDYVVQAAQGLAYAHGEGVIHRDIKPANLLLDRQGVVKILDMGLARIEGGDDGLTATEQVMGTVDYMSPEQASDTKHADARADIYSLGCTLWYLLTARKAYESDTMIGRLMAHRDAALPSLVKARDDASWPLEQVFHKMIAKRPQDRHQTMEEVIAALTPYAGNRPSTTGGYNPGSSSGIGTSTELASFMQSTGTGPTNRSAAGTQPTGGAATPASPSTGSKTSIASRLEATQQFSGSEADTDPKSAVAAAVSFGSKPSSGSTSSLRARAASGSKSGGANKKKWAVGGIAGVLLLVGLGLTMKFRDSEPAAVASLNSPSVSNVSGTTNVVNTPNSPATPIAVAAATVAATTAPPTPTVVSEKVSLNFEADRRSAELLNAEYRLTLVSPEGRLWVLAPNDPLPSDWFRITKIGRDSIMPGVSASFRDETLLPAFESLTQLEEINDGANRMNINAGSLERLAKAPCGQSLKSLILGASPSSPVVAALGRFPQLKSARLVANSITDPDLAALEAWPKQVTRLALYDFDRAQRLTADGLKRLGRIPARDLVFEASDLGINGDTFAALATNPNLRSLTFRTSGTDYSFGDGELLKLRGSQSLRFVDLNPPKKSTSITDAGVRTLASTMPNCSVVWSGGTITARNDTRFLKPKTGETIDLLSVIDPEVHAHKGSWEKQAGALLTSPDPEPCSLELPIEPAASYRLEATVERLSGVESFGMVLIVGNSEVRLVFDGYRTSGIRTGLDLLDGKKPIDLADSFQQQVLLIAVPTQIVVDVAPERVAATSNGINVVDFRGDSGRLSLEPRAVIDYRIPPKTLSVFAYRPQFRLTKLTYTPKSD